jgi:hypothetical protein
VQGMYLIFFLDSQSCFSLHFLSLHSVACSHSILQLLFCL